MWEGKWVTDLTRLLGDLGTAKRAANFLLATGELSQSRHANEPSNEDDALWRHTTGDAEVEDILYSKEYTG